MHPRLVVELPVMRRTKDTFVSETLRDISNGGLALVTSAPLTVGQLEELVLTSLDKKSEISLHAEVVHVHPTEHPGRFSVGLRFAYVDAAAASKVEALLLDALTARAGSRAGPRVGVQTEAFWSGAINRATANVQLLNAGLGGALIAAPQVPATGEAGLLAVRPVDDAELIAVPARVVWSRTEGDRAIAGLAFDSAESSRELVGALLESLLFAPRRPATPTAPCSPGTIIGGFELGALIARGRSCEIYRARALDPMGDAAGAESVALRRFQGSASEVAVWTERFLSSVDIGSRLLTHRGVLRVYGAAADRNECWLTTEHLPGTSFDRVLSHFARRGRASTLEGVLTVMVEVLRTLHHCHTLGPAIVHGDLRPSNVLLGNGGEVKLLGFGAAPTGLAPRSVRVAPDRLPYLPPELYLHGRDAAPSCDIYQAGVLLYEALTAVTPFPISSIDRLERAVARGPVAPSKLNPKVTPAIEKLILAALSADPAARPQSAAELADRIAACEQCPSDPTAALIERVGLVDETRRRVRDTSQSISLPITVGERPALGSSGEAPTERRTAPPPPALGAEPEEKTLANWKPRQGALTRGQVLGRYEILGKLAQGGMAEVFLARLAGPSGFTKTFVIKTILQGHDARSEFVRLFLNEARVASLINHPNIVQLFDFGFDRHRPYLAMEYLEGRNLSQTLAALDRAGKKLPPSLAARIIADCLAGLDHAHTLKDAEGKGLGIVHRDVSAKNILIAYAGQVKLLDFGIAKATSSDNITVPGMVRGTLGYIAPEQALGQSPTAQVDVWAAGINLYAMLTGSLPFDGDNLVEVMDAVLKHELPLASSVNPDAPEPLAIIADRALAKTPADRFPSAAAMRAEVEEFLKLHPASAYDLAALMESLFPQGKHPERIRMTRLERGQPVEDTEPPPSPEVSANEQVTASTGHDAPTRVVARYGARVNRLRTYAPVVAAGVLAVVLVGWAGAHLGRQQQPPPPVAVKAPPPTLVAEPPAPAAPASGALHIRCNVPCSTAIDGAATGQTPVDLSEVPLGHHRIRVTATTQFGRSMRERDVDLQAGGDETLDMVFGTGKVSISARPQAEVFIGGKSLGSTPLTATMIEGTHDVLLVAKRAKTRRHRMLSISPGEVAELNVDMSR